MLVRKQTGTIVIAALVMFVAAFFANTQIVYANVDVGGLNYALNEKDSVAYVEGFAGSVQMETVTVPEMFTDGTRNYTVEGIDSNAFFGCEDLKRIDLPASVKRIAPSAFENCKYLERVTFPSDSQLKSIDERAFRYCYLLEQIDVPAGVKSIGEYAFASCRKLQNVTFPRDSQLESIEENVFNTCDVLQQIEIPASVKTIGEMAFLACEQLEEVTFPRDSQLELIDNIAFSKCHSLKRIKIPAGVERIGGYAFEESGLRTVEFAAGTKIKKIGAAAFKACGSLTSVVLPAGLTSIEAETFTGCSKLTGLLIPASVTGIGDKAFCGAGQEAGSFSLAFAAGSRLESIGEGALEDTGVIDGLTIPPHVTSLGACGSVNWSATATVHYIGTHGQWTSIPGWEAWEASVIASGALHCVDDWHISSQTTAKATPEKDGKTRYTCGSAGCEGWSYTDTIARPADIGLSAVGYTYDGKAKEPAVSVKDADGNAVDPASYDVAYADNTNAGKAAATVKFKGDLYDGSASVGFTIAKAANTLSVKAKTKKAVAVKAGKKLKAGKLFVVSGANGALTYQKAKGSKKIKVAANGSVKVKKGCKGGTYKLKVQVRAAGDANHLASAVKTVTVKVKVK